MDIDDGTSDRDPDDRSTAGDRSTADDRSTTDGHTTTDGRSTADTTPTPDRSTGETRREGGAGETIGRSLDSARDTLAQSGPRSQLTFVIGLFAIVGAGFGLLGVIVLELLAGGSGGGFGQAIAAALFLVSVLVVVLLTGPVMAALSGLRIAERLDEARATYLTSFVATAVGYVVMVLIAAVLIGLVAGGGGGAEATTTGGTTTNPFDIADLVVPLVALAIPVGLTGLASAFLTRWNATR
ncbi:hypothetical protein [Halococcus thailandensis]|uniref:Uncharacterized protein n=1 Tax=Halococcus thailandensis JCM 13552 TaxID=1227457 RepID=M0N5Q8_9EURY|nr:hypothetical protein [Halococcus thailandensis]EMA52893.1 hypothetical protein C451_10750 [Halococcus thailandensis JCM 13552]